MKVAALQINLTQFIVRDNDARGIGLRIQSAANFKACLGGRCRNQIDDYFVADEWFTAPVLADIREETMFNLVPFAGAWRQVTHSNRQVEFIGQFLEFDLPQP